jgi:hypothetical protein
VEPVEYVQIADPDKPGDYLVLAKREFDPATHELFDPAAPPARRALEPGSLETAASDGGATGTTAPPAKARGKRTKDA